MKQRVNIVNFIIKQIETRMPHCSIDPVLKTLSRCHEINPRLRKAKGPVEIPYSTYKIWKESKDAFMTNLSGWSRLGPVLAWGFAATCWLYVSFVVYQAAKISGIGKTVQLKDVLSGAAWNG